MIKSKIFYFNKAGLLLWILQGSVLKNQTLGSGNIKIHNLLLHLIKKIDPTTPTPEMSLIAHVSVCQ